MQRGFGSVSGIIDRLNCEISNAHGRFGGVSLVLALGMSENVNLETRAAACDHAAAVPRSRDDV
jgi:hypothetical protein